MQNNKFYQMEEKEVLAKVNSNISGLTTNEALKRLKLYGKNLLPKEKKKNVIELFFSQFKDSIIWIMILACIFSFIVDEVIDGIVIVFIIFIDAILGTFQEWKAGKSADSLKKLIKVKVKVLRDKKEILINSEEVTIGDIILMESGDKIVADIRLLQTTNFAVDESVLTGESVAVVKNHLPIKEASSISDTKNMAYAGCSVVTGRSIGVVTAIKTDTEIGHIATKVIETKEEKSPLVIRMEKFSHQITLIILAISIILTLIMLIKGMKFEEIFLSVVALGVSAMPEGLPLALTLALTIASTRMSKKNVIVKKLNAVESLGSCTVIASDKTGTLTVNEQTAKKVLLPNGDTFEITGTGYNDKGKIVAYEKASFKSLKEIAYLGMINNEATLEKQGKNWNFFGDTIDIAFLALSKKVGITKEKSNLVSIPYESEKGYSAVFYKENDTINCTIKGSLEKILTFCDKMQDSQEVKKIDKDFLLYQNEQLAKDGYRVIALAKGVVNNFKEKEFYDEKDIPNLTFMGLVAFIDPVRKEVKNAIKKCHTAGIDVLMITGDHPLTALSIARELNLASNNKEITTGKELAKYLDSKDKKEFDNFIKDKKVFARVTPIQKLEIVNSLKRRNEFVAVTGDGVNDAPAIKAANLGVAMGSGTDVSKETATMIITDDNFLSIVKGIEEGRGAYSNIRKVAYFLISSGFAEVLFFTLSIIFDLPLPLVAIQLLWINIVTDGFQDMALSFEKNDKDVMTRKPRSTKEPLFDKILLKEVLVSGLTMGLLVFTFWFVLLKIFNFDISIARGYVMTLMVFIQNLHVFNCRSEDKSIFKTKINNPFLFVSITVTILLQIIIMEIDNLNILLSTSSIPLKHLIIIFLLSLPIIIVMESYKYISTKQKQ